jgi:hypothetical protein
MKDKGVNKKMVLILLSIAHICCFVIFVIYLYTATLVADYSGETAKSVPEESVEYSEVETTVQTEIETETVIETETEIETQTEIETETETEIETQTETQTQAEQEFAGTFTVVTEIYKLNVRQEPTVNSAVVGKLSKGATGTVIEIVDNYWALVEYDGLQGYCSMEYLEIEQLQ